MNSLKIIHYNRDCENSLIALSNGWLGSAICINKIAQLMCFFSIQFFIQMMRKNSYINLKVILKISFTISL